MPADRAPSKASELRRSTKPIMEKRRRARINHSLTELKNLILDALKKDNARHSKLEKADILEMTVKHLQQLQRQQAARSIVSDSSVTDKFRAGYRECAAEVGRYLGRLDGVDGAVRQRVMGHLASRVSELSTPPPSPGSEDGGHFFNAAAGSVQLLPTRLPSGEIAFLLPQPSQLSVYAPVSPPATPGLATTATSSGILSPACSERSVSSSSASLSSPPSPVSPSSCSSSSTFSHHQSLGLYGVMPATQAAVKVEDEAVWRPW
ncbi:protein deadpan-like [Dermacentor andersoni]|uniref:protein deadpan-like n=1 Tax=Dermacentor andersoni TaxID=34620 RepID=UPI0021555240|nr:transcription factor HES-4-B-like [Dermacentor andersoni]